MKCEEFLNVINDYIDGDIDPKICDEFSRHLEECDPCRIMVDTVRKTITLYRAGDPLELPDDFRKRLHETLQKNWKAGRDQFTSAKANNSK